jgi:hypothetical protein
VARIVGWILHQDSACEKCGKTAVVIAVEDWVPLDGIDLCSDCVPSESADPIAEVFARALLQSRDD